MGEGECWEHNRVKLESFHYIKNLDICLEYEMYCHQLTLDCSENQDPRNTTLQPEENNTHH